MSLNIKNAFDERYVRDLFFWDAPCEIHLHNEGSLLTLSENRLLTSFHVVHVKRMTAFDDSQKSDRWGWWDFAGKVALFLVLVAGLVIRVVDLGARPMHADEANQAVKLGELLETGKYRFDPVDHHGPSLYYFAWVVARVAQQESLVELTESSLRVTTALFGAGAVVLVWLIMRPLGRGSALAAAAFMAVSPPAVYFSRYFIQESLLVTFGLLAWFLGERWLRGGRVGSALSLGAVIGLMLATKASAVVFILLTLGALVAVGAGKAIFQRMTDARSMTGLGLTAFLVWLAFYSSFGSNFSGAGDALKSLVWMFSKAIGGQTGHEKSWWYYGSLFFFQNHGGYVWDQTVFILLAGVGVVAAWKTGLSAKMRFMAVYVLALALILSLTPYKTPWIVVNFVPALCLLAGFGVTRWKTPIALGAAAVVVALLTWQARQAAFVRPADVRNPYAYQHTSRDLLKVKNYAAALREGSVVKIISPEYWPLPWYLRGTREVGYWSTPPAECEADLIIVDAAQAEVVRARLKAHYSEAFVGLRPGYTLVMFLRESGG